MRDNNKHFRKTAGVLLAILICISPIFLVVGKTHASNDAYFSLTPTSGNFNVGNTFVATLTETATSGDNMIAFQANLSYNSSLLQYVSTALTGPFTLSPQNSGGSGLVNLACAATTTQTGTQSIATFTFNIISNGSTSVSMTTGSDIDNLSGNSVWNSSLPSSTINLIAPPSISITNLSSSQEIYGKSFAVDSTVTANDAGSITNNVLSVDSSAANTLTNGPYNFSLNTLNYSDGLHTLSVKATDDLSQTNTASVSVYISNGDINSDGHINISDLAVLATNWGKSSGATYSQGDISGDGKINVSDLAIMAANWGWSD